MEALNSTAAGMSGGTWGPSASAGAVLQGLEQVMAQARDVSLESPGGAGAVLGGAPQFVALGDQLVANIDRGIEARTQKLAAAEASGGISGPALSRQRDELEVMAELRDRIASTVERVRTIVAAGGASPSELDDRRRLEQLELERLRHQLQQQVAFVPPAAAGPQVAAVYDAGSLPR